jgi:hypothetical protein
MSDDALERILEGCGRGFKRGTGSVFPGGAEEIHLKPSFKITDNPAKV